MSGVRVGIVGFGFMGRVHASAWTSTRATVVAVLLGEGSASADLVRAAGYEPFTDIDAFLSAIDIVDICSPTHLHRELAMSAAAAGRAVLCEKPLALTTADATEVVREFEHRELLLQVAHVLRFDAQYSAARDVVARGELGEVAVVRLSRLSFAPRRGDASWFTDVRKSGGIVFDLMIHDLDYARWVAGDVRSVYARASPGGPGHAIALLSHESGAISHVEGSWANPDPSFITRGEIAGTGGFLELSSEKASSLSVVLAAKQEESSTGMGEVRLTANPFELQAQHFLDVLEGRAQSRISARDGLAAVSIAEAAQRSIVSGRPEPVASVPGGGQ